MSIINMLTIPQGQPYTTRYVSDENGRTKYGENGNPVTEQVPFPDGAYCPCGISGYNTPKDLAEKQWVLVLYESHQGLCISSFERNMYDDSDFIMIVWDPVRKEPKNIEFASTRGWSYPCYGSSPDATPEVIAEYQAWQKNHERRTMICKRLAFRKQMQDLKVELSLSSRAQAQKLYRALNGGEMDAIKKLLKTKNFRSEFRKSLAEQVRKWIEDPQPTHMKPLSPRQWMHLY